ncbi:MAG: sulfate transporter CysZ [Pseudomonadota bacterium]
MNLSPIKGVSYFVDGIQIAKTKPVRPFVVLPACASLIIIGTGLAIGFSYIEDLALYLRNALPEWLSFLNFVLAPLLYAMGILIGAWMFGFIATVLASPFLGELSLRVDQDQVGLRGELDNIPMSRQIVATLGREARKLGYQLPRLFALVLVSLVPLVNAFAPLLWLSYGAWMMGVQFCDYAHENRQRPFRETLDLLRPYRIGVMGFGACVTVGLSIPLLNIFVAPVATVGATTLMNDLLRAQTVSRDVRAE